MIALLKLSPVLLLAGLMIFGEFDILTAAPLATIYAAILAMLVSKMKFEKIFKVAIENVKEFIIVFFILMLAYGLAEAFMATGVGASVISIALNLGISARTVALVGFLVTSVLSIATGTSWATVAACAPIFLWLNHIVDGNILLTTASIFGGACFGDNIGLISDTTVVSSGLQKVEVIHRVRHQGVWSVLCLVAAAIVILLVSSGYSNAPGSGEAAIAAIPPEAWEALEVERPAAVFLLQQVQSGVPLYMVIPLLIVLALAFSGRPTFICLVAGIFSALIFGLIAGTVTSVPDFLELVEGGFADAGSWSIVMMMWVGAFGGIMNAMNAFEPLARGIVKIVRNVRQLMTCNALMCLLGNAALADEMAQIVTISPIIKSITDENVEASEEDMYKLRLRNATFSDAMAVYGSQLIPWHVYMVFFTGIAAAVYPMHDFVITEIIKYNYMAFITVGSMLILTFTGLDRFIPLFKIPREPDVRLKNKTAKPKTEAQ